MLDVSDRRLRLYGAGDRWVSLGVSGCNSGTRDVGCV